MASSPENFVFQWRRYRRHCLTNRESAAEFTSVKTEQMAMRFPRLLCCARQLLTSQALDADRFATKQPFLWAGRCKGRPLPYVVYGRGHSRLSCRVDQRNRGSWLSPVRLRAPQWRCRLLVRLPCRREEGWSPPGAGADIFRPKSFRSEIVANREIAEIPS